MTTKEDYAYIAGLVDGEGSIFVSNAQRTTSYGGRRHVLELRISNSDKATLEWVQQTMGCGVVYRNMGGGKREHFNYGVRARSAGGVIASVMPYLRIKRRRGAMALLFQSRITPRRCNRVPDEEFRRRETLMLGIRELNNGGE